MKKAISSAGNSIWLRTLAHFTAGGRWSEQLPTTMQRNLRWFWFDGVCAQASDAIVITYLPLFVLALGATEAQIGWMSALGSAGAMLVLLPGALLVEKFQRHRKLICVASGGGIGRWTLPLLALLPLCLRGQPAIYAAIVLSMIRDMAGNLSLPAWTAITADIVPLAWRGHYFGSRNLAMGVAGILTTYLVGEFITHLGAPVGYQWALLMAFGVGMASTLFFAQLDDNESVLEAAATAPATSTSEAAAIRRQFAFLCLSAVVWNFSLNLAGPFFNVYLYKELGASAAMVGILTVMTSFSGLPAQRLFGRWADRWGPRRVQLLTALLIPLLPLAWVLVRTPWHVAPINLASGFLWAGYNLASFNLLLALMPAEQRARYSAIYQLLVIASLGAGAAVGGQMITHWGYTSIFVCSGIGRLIAALIFARWVQFPIIPKH